MNLLELFSGTHSIGKVAAQKGYKVYSLDRDLGDKCPFDSGYKSYKHFKEDIFKFDYKQFPKKYFKVITASPVCLWWSNLRNTSIGRKLKGMDRPLTMEDINNDIEKFGIPMVDKIFEIIEYLEPDYWWIENPQTGKMKNYIGDFVPFYDVDYCQYSDFGYKKTTRFWTNIEGFIPKRCDGENCINLIGDTKKQRKHKNNLSSSKTIILDGKYININTKELRIKYKDFPNVIKRDKITKLTNKYERYRIPFKLIKELLECIE